VRKRFPRDSLEGLDNSAASRVLVDIAGHYSGRKAVGRSTTPRGVRFYGALAWSSGRQR
jgi:hypothetical protein